MKHHFKKYIAIVLTIITAALYTFPVKAVSIEMSSVVNVKFNDTNLENSVKQALDKPADYTVTSQDMLGLTELYASDKNISDLTGIEYAINLKYLYLNDNQISDLLPLKGLTNLFELSLSNNKVSIIDCLSELSNLYSLELNNNMIEDITSLMINLEKGGFINGGYIDLTDNNLDVSPTSQTYHILQTLKENNVEVAYTPQNYISSPKITTTDPIDGSLNVPLNKSMTITFSENVSIGSNFTEISLRDSSNQTKEIQSILNGNILTITPNENLVFNTTYTVTIPSGTVKDSSGNQLVNNYSFSFTTSMPDPGTVVVFNDASLVAAIRKALNKPTGLITAGDMASLTAFYGNYSGITDLKGLEYAINLKTLNLGENNISNLTPIANLTGLTDLKVYDNRISDLTSLKNLYRLQYLHLGTNNITDLTPISGLTNLINLNISYNQLSDLSPISSLDNLQELNLNNNLITNISPIAGLINLSALSLGNNNIGNFNALSNLTNLHKLGLENNKISQIPSLTNLTNLQELRLSSNQISDISTLSSLINLLLLDISNNQLSNIDSIGNLNKLQYLSLSYNQIYDISILSSLINLEYLYLSENQISNITSLSGLMKLKHLALSNNNLSTITPLSGLDKLTYIILNNNRLTDISPISTIAQNGGLPGGGSLYLYNNYLDITQGSQALSIIQPLINKGVYVYYEPQKQPESIPPTISRTIPSPGITEIPVNSTIIIEFNENIKSAYNYNSISIKDDSENVVAVSKRIDDNRLVITPVSSLDYGKIYTVTIPTGSINDDAGNLLSADYSFSFRTTLFDPSISVNFNDTNLKNAVRLVINKTEGQITAGDMATLNILDASSKGIIDLTGLEYAVNLYELYLNDNKITDINPLTELTKLSTINLKNNFITDISPLVINNQNGGLTTGYHNVELSMNYLDLTVGSKDYNDIQSLLQGGVTVYYQNQKPIDSVPPSVLNTVPNNYSTGIPVNSDIAINFTEDLLKGINFNAINLKNSSGNTIPITVSINSKTISIVPSDNLSSNTTYTVTIPSSSVQDLAGNVLASDYIVYFSTTLSSYDPAAAVTFNDASLEAVVRQALGKSSGQITAGDMDSLTALNGQSRGISDISDLIYATNLQELYFAGNSISDISPLENLNNLQTLDLSYNQISSIVPLRNLAQLQSLYLGNNLITSLGSLQSLTSLQTLSLSGNQISDITPLSGLENLQDLESSNNTISDITSLSGLINLQKLNLESNLINDIGAIASLTNLRELKLTSNQINDISLLSNLANLNYLTLADNQISNIASLSGLINLHLLSLNNNQLSEIQSLSGLVNLQILYLGNNHIEDITPLGDMFNLRFLKLNNNKLRSISTLVAISDGGGLSYRAQMDISSNRLDISEGSQPYRDIQTLINRGVSIIYEPQTPIYDDPPLITCTIPISYSNDVSINSNINVQFNENIQPGDSINNISVNDSSGNIIPITININSDVLNITPVSPLNYSTAYSVTVPSGSVKDIAGNAFVENFTFVFTTESEPLIVISADPSNGSSEVAVNKRSITVMFNMDIKAGSGYNSISLKSQDGKTINITTSIDKNTLFIKPEYNLEYNTNYNVIVPQDAICGTDGSKLVSNYTFGFTTKPEDIPLMVVSSSPQEGFANVPRDSIVTITFNRNISTVLSADKTTKNRLISLKNTAGGNIPITYSAVNNTLIIKPKIELEFGTSYELIIPSGSIWDDNKNKLKENYMLTFTIEEIQPQNEEAIIVPEISDKIIIPTVPDKQITPSTSDKPDSINTKSDNQDIKFRNYIESNKEL